MSPLGIPPGSGLVPAFQGTLNAIVGARAAEAPIGLLDVVRTNGDSFHWANAPFVFAPVFTGNAPSWATLWTQVYTAFMGSAPPAWDNFYFPWLLNVDGFHAYRTMQTDSATIVVQNVSGNTLRRDLATLMRAATFEGAIFAFRTWYPQSQQAGMTQIGRLTVANAGETECQFSTAPRFEEGSYDGNCYEYSETCQWTYAHAGCDDTTNNPCSNSYPTCRQPGRFRGVLNTFQINLSNGDSLAQIQTTPVNRMRMF